MRVRVFTVVVFGLLIPATCLPGDQLPAVGAAADTGCGESPEKVQRLQITKAGTYENYLVDGRWVDRNLVKINSSKVILVFLTIVIRLLNDHKWKNRAAEFPDPVNLFCD